MPRSLSVSMRWGVYGLTSFWGAYLLFQLEPLIGKFILPWFGGSPTVWITCMLFFQVFLLLGYAYAHLNLKFFSAANQALLQSGLLILGILVLPVTPAQSFKPVSSDQPIFDILSLLASNVGLPYFILSTTSPLLQAWIVRINPYRSPYTLYALSNFGSLLALLSYPFLVEPYFKLGTQTLGWSWGFVLYAGLSLAISFDFQRLAKAKLIYAKPITVDDAYRLSDSIPPKVLGFFWLALPTASSILLLATTNQLCQDVASVPFLWILPLSLYVLSFIICFASHNWYQRKIYIPLTLISAIALVVVLHGGGRFTLITQVCIYSLGLFFCCLTCHGELFRLRPHPKQLTLYYLVISLGGAFGGVFVALLAPLLFPLYFEFHIGLFACCLLTLTAVMVESQWFDKKRQKPLNWLVASAVLFWLAVNLVNQAYYAVSGKTIVSRNFYGVLRIEERALDQPALANRAMRHGAIDHGFQFLAVDKQAIPTAYYGKQSGVALALSHFTKPDTRRIGLVGLGVGTLLSYGNENDYFRIYDINPTVVDFANTYFSFLKNTKAKYDLIVADARLAMEREPPQNFDLIILDAFSGDAIPMHLLTDQALQLYLRHLNADGALLIHITNHYLDLKPLMHGIANRLGFDYVLIKSPQSSDDVGSYRADWVLLSKNQAFLQQTALQNAKTKLTIPTNSILWTDDFSNMFRLLK